MALQSNSKADIQSAFDVFVRNKNLKKLILIHSEVDKIWSAFSSLFSEVIAAGGLVFNEKGEVLMIHRRGFWDLPKGKLEKKERIKDCAVREVEEECGLDGVKLIEKLCITYHLYSLKKDPSLKPSHWFIMSVTGNPKLVPQAEEEIDKAKWVNLKKAEKLLEEAYPSIKEVFMAYKKKESVSE